MEYTDNFFYFILFIGSTERRIYSNTTEKNLSFKFFVSLLVDLPEPKNIIFETIYNEYIHTW